MKKRLSIMLTLVLLLSMVLVACNGKDGLSSNKELSVINTYKETESELVQQDLDNDKVVTVETYYEMSDGTWKTDKHAYKYKLELSGRIPNVSKDSTFILLSNIKDISFDQAYKAFGLSSNTEDYFNEEETVIVGMQLNHASGSENTKDGKDASYKPMVKVDDKIYGWVRDLEEVKLDNLEFLGEIKISKDSLSESLNDEDENFTSNIFPVGVKVYRWDEKSVLIEFNDVFSVCEIIE